MKLQFTTDFFFFFFFFFCRYVGNSTPPLSRMRELQNRGRSGLYESSRRISIGSSMEIGSWGKSGEGYQSERCRGPAKVLLPWRCSEGVPSHQEVRENSCWLPFCRYGVFVSRFLFSYLVSSGGVPRYPTMENDFRSEKTCFRFQVRGKTSLPQKQNSVS